MDSNYDPSHIQHYNCLFLNTKTHSKKTNVNICIRGPRTLLFNRSRMPSMGSVNRALNQLEFSMQNSSFPTALLLTTLETTWQKEKRYNLYFISFSCNASTYSFIIKRLMHFSFHHNSILFILLQLIDSILYIQSLLMLLLFESL